MLGPLQARAAGFHIPQLTPGDFPFLYAIPPHPLALLGLGDCSGMSTYFLLVSHLHHHHLTLLGGVAFNVGVVVVPSPKPSLPC